MLALTNAGRRIEDAWIWRHLSFEVTPNARMAIVGPSGAGKTLLLRALAGLESLDEGRITYEGRELSDWGLPRYRAQVMYLPQSPALAEGSVEDNLRLAFEFEVHRERTYSRERIGTYLDRLNRPEDFLNRNTRVLSGGEQQIVALLRALQLDPRVLLLDEPTANVDVERTRQIETLLRGWLEEQPKAAFLWTSHDAAQIERMTDRRIDLSARPAASRNPSNAVRPHEEERYS